MLAVENLVGAWISEYWLGKEDRSTTMNSWYQIPSTTRLGGVQNE